MRQITSHKLNGLNDSIQIEAIGEPGRGGDNHTYFMTTPPPPEKTGITGVPVPATNWQIKFQEGPIAEAGINGVSNEALVAILIDRLQCFQAGDFKCRENAIALTHLEDAMHWLQHRTRARLARGIEGSSAV